MAERRQMESNEESVIAIVKSLLWLWFLLQI